MTGRTEGLIPALAALLLASCGPGEAHDPELERLGRATGPVSAGPVIPADADAARQQPPDGAPAGGKSVHDGVVLERIQVPNYTYLRIGRPDGREEWAAVPKAEIAVGAQVRVVESLLMRAFRSPTLDRTFEVIVFGTLDGAPARAADAGPDEAAPSLPPGHPPI